jgi:hypothetical protein
MTADLPSRPPEAESDNGPWAALFFLLILVGTVVQWSRAEPFPVPSYDLFNAAVVPCQSYVKGRLSTPATAAFPWRVLGAKADRPEVRTHKIRGGHRYEVISYVDAQNPSAAVVRTRFYCSVDRIARGGDFVGLFVSRRPWPLVDLRMAPWLATTREDRIAQASWAIAANDDAFLRDLVADWIRIDPDNSQAVVAEAVSRYWDRDYAHVSRRMSNLLTTARLPAEWDRTAKAIYAGALAEQELQAQRALGARGAIGIFLATARPSLFSQGYDAAYEDWARANGGSLAGQ